MVGFELNNEGPAADKGRESEGGTLHRLASLKAQPGSHHHFSDVEVRLRRRESAFVCFTFFYHRRTSGVSYKIDFFENRKYNMSSERRTEDFFFFFVFRGKMP